MTNCPEVWSHVYHNPSLYLFFFPLSTSSCLSFPIPLPLFQCLLCVMCYEFICRWSRSIILSWRQGREVDCGMPWHREQGRALSIVLRSFAHSLLRPLRLSLPVCFHDPRNAPAVPLIHSCLTCTSQTHPSHPHQAPHNCNNTVPGLTRNPSPYKPRCGLDWLDWPPALVSSYTG